MSQTSIEWTQQTWNPVRGCSRVSPGCQHCYAERQAARNLPGMKSPTTGEPFSIMKSDGPHWTGKVELIPSMLDIPLRRKKPTTWFVNSMSDLFHEDLGFKGLVDVFSRMSMAHWHTFQVLTKRASSMKLTMTDPYFVSAVEWHVRDLIARREGVASWRFEWPLPNVWLGVSVEDQERADERIPLLLKTPAAVRFLSVEPLLGPVDLLNLPGGLNALTGWRHTSATCSIPPQLRGVDWVIVGGESGPGARPMHPDWARGIRDQCVAAGVPFFFKQWGGHRPATQQESEAMKGVLVEGSRLCGYYCDPDENGGGHYDHRQQLMVACQKKAAGRLLDGRTWDEMPEVHR